MVRAGRPLTSRPNPSYTLAAVSSAGSLPAPNCGQNTWLRVTKALAGPHNLPIETKWAPYEPRGLLIARLPPWFTSFGHAPSRQMLNEPQGHPFGFIGQEKFRQEKVACMLQPRTHGIWRIAVNHPWYSVISSKVLAGAEKHFPTGARGGFDRPNITGPLAIERHKVRCPDET